MNYFDEIYRLANQGNKAVLAQFISDNNVSIDVCKKSTDFTAAEQFAFEKKREAVNLLIDLDAEPAWIVRGAARAGDFEFVEHLLKNGASISAAAQGAAQGKYRKQAEQLIQRNANIDAVAVGAVYGEDLDFAEEMRQGAANINLIAHAAAACGHIDYADDLRRQGANINTIASGAARGGLFDYAQEMLLLGADINQVAKGAARGGQFTFAESLLEKGASLEAVAEGAQLGGYFYYAMECKAKINYFDKIYELAKQKNREALKILLSDVKISISVRKPGKNFTVARVLASENDMEALNVLRAFYRGIDFEAQGAAYAGNIEYAEQLRSEGANINAIAQGAAERGDHTYIELLKKEGASIDVIALGAAISGNWSFVELLRQQGASIKSIVHGALTGKHVDFVKSLHQSGWVESNFVAASAAAAGCLDYAEELRQAGADINIIAFRAARGGFIDYPEMLRKQGASIHHIAYGAALSGNFYYAEMLRSQGAHINGIAEGATAIRGIRYVEYLRSQGADIDVIAKTSVLIGNLQYADKLRELGANIQKLIHHANMKGYDIYADHLRQLSSTTHPVAHPVIPLANPEGIQTDIATEADLFLSDRMNVVEEGISSHDARKRERESDETSESSKKGKRASKKTCTTSSAPTALKSPWQKNALFSAKYSATYERLPSMPLLLSTNPNRINYANSFAFQSLESCEKPKNTTWTPRLIHHLAIGNSAFRLSTLKQELPSSEDTVTFIFAGRKEKAMFPQPALLGEQQRLLLVVSAQEYEHLSQHHYGDAIEFLIIDCLSSVTHGAYEETADIQARRLAAFLVSFEWRLKHCLHLDDNLQLIQASAEFSSLSTWAELTTALQEGRESDQALMCGMRTFSYKPRYYLEPDYCYKLFDIDFEQVIQILNISNAEDVFILGYPAAYSGYCMQDFYFQMIIDFAIYYARLNNSEAENGATSLIHLPSMESVSLKRMQQYKNAARIQTKGWIEDILEIDIEQFAPSKVTENYASLMKDSLKHLQNEINRCFDTRANKRRQLENQDVRRIVQANNQMNDHPEHPSEEQEPEQHQRTYETQKQVAKQTLQYNIRFLENQWPGSSLNQLILPEAMNDYLQQGEISSCLYPHQVKALEALLNCDASHAVMKMTTGSGKTRVQILLANFLIKHNPQAVIHIVVPTIQLVNQFYMEFQDTLQLIGSSCAIKAKNVIPVHSKENAVPTSLIALNNILRERASIYIFCETSYSKLLATDDENLSRYRTPLIVFLDEFHLYKKRALKLVNSGVTTLGFSATPGSNMAPLYEFNRKDALAAKKSPPLIIDRLSYSLNQEKNDKKHEKIASILNIHRHPMGQPLASYKGIIYTSSIDEANQLVAAINVGHPSRIAQAIHSRVKDYKKWIEKFNKKSMETPAILVVVDMLGTGYNDKDVAWALYAKNKGSCVENHSQMIGRVLRTNSRYPHKIAYILSDDDLLLDTCEIYKDEQALVQAHPDYYKFNREVIYLELVNAIDKARPFEHYSAMFKHKLLHYSLPKLLFLLLKANAKEQQDWITGLLELDHHLSLSWNDHRGRVFNLLSTFLNEVLGLQQAPSDVQKQALYNAATFEVLLNKIYITRPALLSQLMSDLSAKTNLARQLKLVEPQYGLAYEKYYLLLVSEGLIGASLGVREQPEAVSQDESISQQSTSSAGLSSNRYTFLNVLNTRDPDDTFCDREQSHTESGFFLASG